LCRTPSVQTLAWAYDGQLSNAIVSALLLTSVGLIEQLRRYSMVSPLSWVEAG
jgi:hypothetical protein